MVVYEEAIAKGQLSYAAGHGKQLALPDYPQDGTAADSRGAHVGHSDTSLGRSGDLRWRWKLPDFAVRGI
jgi:hypothetical protein